MFQEAVSQALPEVPLNYKLDACPDQYVGPLIEITSNAADFPLRQHATKSADISHRVLLILESPHREEFTEPFGPAKGTTGRLIRRYLGEILPDKAIRSSGLFLVNAVQNQCSLGFKPGKYRDQIFLTCWKLYSEANFIQRLKLLVDGCDSVIVINACTKGSKKLPFPLREIVEGAITEAIGRPSDVRITHPASWAKLCNRRATWESESLHE